MRHRNEKTTKQIENEELSRLTDASAGNDRATTQLDPSQLRALLGGEPPAPIAETPTGTGAMPRAASPSPEPPVGTGALPHVARREAESTAEVPPIGPRNRWIMPVGAVVLAAAALVAVLSMR